MIKHYFTLKRITDELQFLIGSRIVSVFTQEKNSLLIEAVDSADAHYIYFNTDNKYCSFFLYPNFHRAKKNTAEIFDTIIEETIQSIELIENDRIIKIKLTNTDLYFFLYGGPNSNLIAVNKDLKIVDAFKNSKTLIGTQFQLQETKQYDIFNFPKETKLIDALNKSKYNLGKYYSEEIILRLGFDENILLNDLNEIQHNTIENEVDKLIADCINSNEFYIYKDSKGKFLLTLIKLDKYTNIAYKFSSINQAVYRKYVNLAVSTDFEGDYKSLTNRINRVIEKIRREKETIENDDSSEKRVETYRKYGELLISLPNVRLKPVNSEIECTDWDNVIYQITVDIKITYIENSQKYFDKAKKEQMRFEIRKKQLPQKLEKLNTLLTLANELEKINNIKDLDRFKIKIKPIIGRNMEEMQNEPSSRFRTFDLGDGYIVYVGKNAANNDELTMKFAKPNDIWMHARGSGGSHTVLAMNSNEKPPKNILQKAASIAAYYSQARNAKYVPVAYTQKKNVRKPKGANTGSVVINREEVIMVEPKLPE